MTMVNFFSSLFYVKIPASHQSEDSELWALTAILVTKQTAMKRHSAELALEKFAVAWKVRLSHNTEELHGRRPRGAAVYGLGGSDTSDTPVKQGAAVLEGAPDLKVPMPVLAYKQASIENDEVCIGLWCFYWSVFALV